ncbi:MAG: histidine phosphatase family protein [Acidimicrobiales bacterium]|nr:histidine phosphatase family protein [Acidimicrobiales bacterium]
MASHLAPTRLVLVRHGESVVTVDRVVGGPRTCSGLSPLGRRQAEALRDRLAATGELADADVLVSSTMPRARETAEILAPALGDLPVVEDDALIEHHPGEADGISWDDFVDRYGVPDLERDPYLPFAPGAESLAEFHLRVGRALFGLADAHAGRTAVIACHGGVVDVAFRAFLRLPMTAPFELHTVNTSLTELQLPPVPAGGDGEAVARASRWRLVRYNDAAHLAGVPTA